MDEQASQQTFGSMLRQARERSGMSVEAIAGSIKLPVDVVEHLENSRIDELPSVAFARGYAKTYARLVGLPEAQIVQAFNASLPGDDKGYQLSSTAKVSRQATSTHPGMKFATYTIVVVFGLLVYYWLQQNNGQDSPEPPAVTETAESPAEIGGEAMQDLDRYWENRTPEEATDDFAELDQAQSAQVTEETTPDLAIAPEQPAIPQALSTPVTQNPRAASDTADRIPAGTEPKVPGSAEPEAMQSTSSENAVAQSTAATAGDMLVLTASEDCWAEINDANGKRLYYDLVKSGMTKEFQGQAPFRVFLGFAPSVEIKINGQAFDFSSYVRRNKTAKFNVKAQ